MEFVRYGGISQMRKGEEKIEDCMCGSSHHDLLFSLPDNFMEYIQMIRDQSFRDWKSVQVAHDKILLHCQMHIASMMMIFCILVMMTMI